MTPKDFWYLVAIIFMAASGFSFGVSHQAKKELLAEQNAKPMYSSRIVAKLENTAVIAYTIPRCDSVEAKNDGYWFNQYINDSTTFIVVESVDWPFNDECRN